MFNNLVSPLKKGQYSHTKIVDIDHEDLEGKQQVQINFFLILYIDFHLVHLIFINSHI